MNTQSNDKVIAYLTLFSGLLVSGVAIYYSVVGLTAIFAAATIPIIIMGIALELSKLSATVWLKQNWNHASKLIKSYLITAILVLMLITSMGIFGFLSKAHLDQSLLPTDLVSKIQIIDNQIKVEQEYIDTAKKTLQYLDSSSTQIMDRTSSEAGARRAIQLRNSQKSERVALSATIESHQTTISKLSEERSLLYSKVKSFEAEVGPIKYLASFFYNDTTEATLEKAVTWVIITLIVVFDPLAVVLLLAAQTSFQKLKETEATLVNISREMPSKELEEDTETVQSILDSHPYLLKPFVHFTNLNPIVEAMPEAKLDAMTIAKTYIPPSEVLNRSNNSLFVQNEEQGVSNLWSKTVSTSTNITREEYVKTIQDRIDNIKRK